MQQTDRQQHQRRTYTPSLKPNNGGSNNHTPNSSMANMTLFSSSADLSITGGVVNTTEQEDWEALFNPHSALLDYSPATARFHYQQRQQQRYTATTVQPLNTGSSDSYEEDKDEIATPPLPRAENMVVEPNANNLPHLNGIDILPCPSSSFFYPPQEQDPYRTQLMQDIEEQGLADHNDQYHNKTIKEIQIQQQFQEQYQQHHQQQQQKKKYDPEATADDTFNDVEDNNEKEHESKYQRWLLLLQQKQQHRPRRVLLYFILGFVFPPMWIVGAVHVPHQPTSAAIDLLWKRRCRNAFFMFSVMTLFVVIILLVFQPGSIGWRHSPTGSTASIDDSMMAV